MPLGVIYRLGCQRAMGAGVDHAYSGLKKDNPLSCRLLDVDSVSLRMLVSVIIILAAHWPVMWISPLKLSISIVAPLLASRQDKELPAPWDSVVAVPKSDRISPL